MSNKLHRLLSLLHRRSQSVQSTFRHVAAILRNGKIVAIATNSSYTHAESAVLRLLSG